MGQTTYKQYLLVSYTQSPLSGLDKWKLQLSVRSISDACTLNRWGGMCTHVYCWTQHDLVSQWWLKRTRKDWLVKSGTSKKFGCAIGKQNRCASCHPANEASLMQNVWRIKRYERKCVHRSIMGCTALCGPSDLDLVMGQR